MTRRIVRKITIPAALAFFVLALPGAGQAQVSRTQRITDSGTDERLTLELRDADVTQVLASFAQILDVEAEIDPEVRGEISIELHNVRAATALTAVCESVGSLCRIEDGVLRVTKDPNAPKSPGVSSGRADGPSAANLDEPIDMELRDADLRQTLAAFASIAGVELEVDDALDGRVTIQLQDTPVRQALDAVCDVQDCRWELAESEDGPVLRFSPR